MINHNYFVVFDLETDSTNPNKANPIQIAALAVHPRTLEIMPDSEFSAWCKPDDFDDANYYEKHKETINWHAEHFSTTPQNFMESKIANAVSEKTAWKDFMEYLKRWYVPGKAKTKFNAPIIAGYNIFEFDKIIIDRLARKYGNVDTYGDPNIYQKRDTVDIMKLVFAWSENLSILPNYKVDTLREAFGIDYSGIAHEGLKDCYDEASLLIKYLNLHRKCAKKVQGWY